MPSSVLQDNKSPYELLIGKSPIYTSLRVFGSKCYLYLRPYSKNKFDPKSLLCVFLRYNEKYKGYMCFHPPTGKVYICRHVLFDELHFPFEKEYAHMIPPTSTSLQRVWQQGWFQETSDRSTSSFVPVSHNEPLTSLVLLTTVARECHGRTRGIEPASIGDITPSPTVNHEEANDSLQAPYMSSAAQSPDDNQSSSLIFTEEDFPPLSGSSSIVPAARPNNDHSMQTRGKDGIRKPNPKHALFTVTSNYPEPKTVKMALRDPCWNETMTEEVDTLHETDTWDLVPQDE